VIVLIPVSLDTAKRVVREWHSHHDPMVGHMWSTGAVLLLEPQMPLVGVSVVSRPIAPANQDGFTLEVTRLCCRGKQHGGPDKNVASRLLGGATSAAENRGMRLMLSYTRIDEDGTCYRAAGWVPRAEIVKARDWNSGNKRTRWLPGFYEPTTEKIDRIRWEWRPSSAIRAVCKMVFALGEWMRAEQRKRRAA
jgi:hypothetical protein